MASCSSSAFSKDCHILNILLVKKSGNVSERDMESEIDGKMIYNDK